MNVYLGKRVEDTGREGLDNLREVRDIADNIIDDCTSGRIDYRTAMSRMNMLELIIVKDSKIPYHLKGKARTIVDRKREELQEECKR
jgi:hypothetical protein